MSRHLYGHSTSYGGGDYPFSSSSSYLSDGGAASYGAGDPYTASRYSSFDLDAERVPSLYSSQIVDRFRHAGGEAAGGVGAGAAAASVYSHSPWSVFDGRGIGAAASTMAAGSGVKHPAEDLYHQNILGSHTVGQTESLFSTNPLVKRPRLDTASNLPIYPQRPGEKDCAHYMLTRTCKFGDNCKFDHPVWVPEGGIPDWKEVPFAPAIELLPQRPGEPDCPYYLKTQNCMFGFRCKFNHPKDKLNAAAGGEKVQAPDNSVLPERPSEPTCSFYLKTGKCKFGANCKFHHPKDVQMVPTAGQDTVSVQHVESGVNNKDGDGGDAKPTKTFVPFTPALLHNSKGLPIRPGETDCPFYLKTGSCKYGSMCRYNHPDRISMNPPAVSTLAHSIMPSIPATLPLGVLNTATNLLPSIDPRLTQMSLGITPSIYPQRPGQAECDFYMKTGHCSFGERCKFHHPNDRSAPTALAAKQAVAAVQQNVKLTLAGLPRREGAPVCPFYMKTGTCKYGAACRFDHPPPGEAIAMATAQGIGSTSAAEAGEEEGATGAAQ